jgi:hypothetical protein
LVEQHDSFILSSGHSPRQRLLGVSGEPVSPEALHFRGWLPDPERDGLLAKTPAEPLRTMTVEMLDDVHQMAPKVANWLSK